jgi:hypothetical protein
MGSVRARARTDPSSLPTRLLDFAALLLARALTRQSLLCAASVARLQIEGVLLDILDDIFLLHLALEPAKRAFDRFAFLYLDFSQA